MDNTKRHTVYAAALFVLLSVGCGKDPAPTGTAPEGMVRVDFLQSGNFGAPFSDTKPAASRAEIPEITLPDGTGLTYEPGPIADGTTLWVAAYEGTPEKAAEAEIVKVKSYRVSGSSLIPCKVDREGNVTAEYDTPLYLPAGDYFFRALGPARELTEDGHGHFALNIDNGQWVIANDERYEETAGDAIGRLTSAEPDCRVVLKPLINQTARLKFTLYSTEDDPFVHTLKMQPVGIELSGLQNHYARENQNGEPWNWTLCSEADTLIAYPGLKNTVVYLKEPSVSSNDRFVIETPILPTDAMATPLVVLFNMEVNGNPTQFEMMLNRKIFRAGYSYHYRGKISIDDGVALLDWESVSWSVDIPFFE